MGSNLGEILRAKLAAQQFMNDTQTTPQPKPALPPHKALPGKITNNINRATFDYVRDNPSTRAEVIKAMVARGYKDGSAGAVLSMMVKQGLALRDSNGVLHATVKEYIPLKNTRTFDREEIIKAKAKVKAQAKAKAKPKAVPLPRKQIVVNVREKKVEERVEVQRPVSVSSPVPARVWSVDDVLNQLSVTQARELLDALKNLFGETK